MDIKFYQKSLCTNEDDHIIFILQFVHVVYHIDQFVDHEPLIHLVINPCYSWIQPINISLMILASIFIRDIGFLQPPQHAPQPMVSPGSSSSKLQILQATVCKESVHTGEKELIWTWQCVWIGWGQLLLVLVEGAYWELLELWVACQDIPKVLQPVLSTLSSSSAAHTRVKAAIAKESAPLKGTEQLRSGIAFEYGKGHHCWHSWSWRVRSCLELWMACWDCPSTCSSPHLCLACSPLGQSAIAERAQEILGKKQLWPKSQGFFSSTMVEMVGTEHSRSSSSHLALDLVPHLQIHFPPRWWLLAHSDGTHDPCSFQI